MRLSTDGLIIREKNVGETDRLVVALTRDRGLVTAFVSGARKIKSKNSSSTSLFAFSNFSFFKNRDTYKIDEAVPIELFFNLRLDIELLALAQYFCELLLHLAPEEEDAAEFLRLSLNALHILQKNDRPQRLTKAVFELRLLSLAGYMPDLSACGRCGAVEDGRMYFDKKSGQLCCPDCRDARNNSGLAPGVLTAMRHIVSVPLERAFAFVLPDEELKALSDLVEGYVLCQTDRTFQTLDFYKAL